MRYLWKLARLMIVGDKVLCCFQDLEIAQRIYEIFVPYLDGGNWVDFRSLNVEVKFLRSTQLSFPVLFSSFSEASREWPAEFRNELH